MKFRKLLGRIIEYYGSQKAFSSAMGMNVGTLSLKLLGESAWTIPEAKRACELLSIPLEELHIYFLPSELGNTN